MVTLSLWMMASSGVNYDGRMHPQVPQYLMSVYHNSEHAQQRHREHWHCKSISVVFFWGEGGGVRIRQYLTSIQIGHTHSVPYVY